MPFWKKGEAPWDYEPPFRPAEPEEGGRAPGLMEELQGGLQAWSEDRREKKRQREIPPPPMACPWCGREMEVGSITGGRDGAKWWPGWPPKPIAGLDAPFLRVDHEGGFLCSYKAAYLCRSCRRMVLEFPEESLEPLGDAAPCHPTETGGDAP